jgi:hypothetical protein
MALTTNLPPQAYTRDTLVKAIEWVSTQPPSVREKASSADLVVSFYLQACRKAASQETPVSGAAFKSDLKNLAEDLKKFEEPSVPPHYAGRLSHHEVPQQQPVQQQLSFHQHTHQHQHSNVRPLPPQPPETYFSPPEPIFKPEAKPEPKPEPPKSAASWPVDARSQVAANELQTRLNLSTETEALRILVTLGAEAAKKLFP